MAAQQRDQNRPLGLGTNRLGGLSDEVFTIAATLLVLDLAVPANAAGNLLQAVLISGLPTWRGSGSSPPPSRSADTSSSASISSCH
jgi:hypothetical protein